MKLKTSTTIKSLDNRTNVFKATYCLNNRNKINFNRNYKEKKAVQQRSQFSRQDPGKSIQFFQNK